MFRRLSRQTFKDFEWVIIDFLYDKTKEYFKELSAQYKVHIKHIPNVRDSFPYMRDISRNRNEALVHADGNTIIFLDDYSVIDQDFIEQHLKITDRGIISCGQMYYIHKNNGFSVTNGYDSFLINKVLDSCPEYDMDSRYEMLNEPAQPTAVLGSEWTYTGNLAVSMEYFADLNGFDPRLSSRGEDGDFGLRANLRGYTIFYNPLARSVNLPAADIPYALPFDHEHPIKFLLEHGHELLGSEGDCLIKQTSMVNKYGCKVAICDRCGAEYILDPNTLIFDKKSKSEFAIDTNLFNLKESRERLRKENTL